MVSCVCDEVVLSTNGINVRTTDSTNIVSIKSLPNGNLVNVNAISTNIMLLSNDTMCEFEIITQLDTGRIKLAYEYEIKANNNKNGNDYCTSSLEDGLVYFYSNIRIVSHSFRSAPVIRPFDDIKFKQGGKRYAYIIEIN